jgi:hypothetical protein
MNSDAAFPVYSTIRFTSQGKTKIFHPLSSAKLQQPPVKGMHSLQEIVLSFFPSLKA